MIYCWVGRGKALKLPSQTLVFAFANCINLTRKCVIIIEGKIKCLTSLPTMFVCKSKFTEFTNIYFVAVIGGGGGSSTQSSPPP